MFSNSLTYEILLLAAPLGILTITGFMLMYYHRKRSLRIQKKLKGKFLDEIENEKIRISRELHDAVSPFTLPLKEFIRNHGHFGEENEKAWLDQILKFETYLSNINETIFPAELMEGDLFEALQKLKNRLFTDENKIGFHSTAKGVISKFNSIHIFRIIQESLINVIKHSNSKFINLVVSQKEKDLICFLSYEVSNYNEEINNKNSLRRGHKIIVQRLELLSGKHETHIENNIKTEKFIFKDIFL
jgi:signal transduction histidine kinase